jgi:hypothetical protein
MGSWKNGGNPSNESQNGCGFGDGTAMLKVEVQIMLGMSVDAASSRIALLQAMNERVSMLLGLPVSRLVLISSRNSRGTLKKCVPAVVGAVVS